MQANQAVDYRVLYCIMIQKKLWGEKNEHWWSQLKTACTQIEFKIKAGDFYPGNQRQAFREVHK